MIFQNTKLFRELPGNLKQDQIEGSKISFTQTCKSIHGLINWEILQKDCIDKQFLPAMTGYHNELSNVFKCLTLAHMVLPNHNCLSFSTANHKTA